MKTLLKYFILVITLFSSFTSINAEISNSKPFPEYDQKLDKISLDYGCSCVSIFGSGDYKICKSGQSCTCTSGWFSCNCNCWGNTDENHANVPNSNLSKVVYVTPAQYNNWKELGAILLSDGSEKGQKAYDLLVEMFESLKKEDYQSYENKTSDMMAQLKMQSVEIREKINALSAKNYSDVRI